MIEIALICCLGYVVNEQEFGRLDVEISCSGNQDNVRMVLRNNSTEDVTIPSAALPWSLSGGAIDWDWSESSLHGKVGFHLINELAETAIPAGGEVEAIRSLQQIVLLPESDAGKLTGRVKWRVNLRTTELLRMHGSGVLRFQDGVCVQSEELFP